LTWQDSINAKEEDIDGQFFLRTSDIGKNRAFASLGRLQQLNYYVKVNINTNPLPQDDNALDELGLSNYNIVILTNANELTQILINNYCRNNKIGFILADNRGLCMRIFNDFGPSFSLNDKNGEIPKDLIIKQISNEDLGLVCMIDGLRHDLETGDTVIIKDVEGMIDQQGKSINGTTFVIKVVNPFEFRISSTKEYSSYVRNGTAKLIKIPQEMKFKSIKECWETNEIPLDNNLKYADFSKEKSQSILHIMFKALDTNTNRKS